MAEKKARTLNIPTYEAQLDDGDVLESELIDDGRTNHERLVDGVRGVWGETKFGAKLKDGAERRGARRETKQENQRQDRSANASLRNARTDARANDPLAQLRLDTEAANATYMKSLAQSRILHKSVSKPERKTQMSELHQTYASMMVVQCMQPLRNGASAESVMSVIGMGASMWLLSPNFREQVGNSASDMMDAISHRLDKRVRTEAKIMKQGNKAEEKLANGKPFLRAKTWQKRLDKMQHAQRGYREPFTAQSAAMTEVGLAEAAYAEMRRPNADVESIQTNHEEALSALYNYAAEDGIERSEISDQMRVIVGQRIERDPQVASVFNELGHGLYVKSKPREVIIAGTTQKVMAWTGDYDQAFAGNKITGGSFSVRPPMTPTEHRARVAQTMSGELASAKSLDELNTVLSNYMVGASTGKYPEAVDLIEDPVAQGQMGRARSMFVSMQGDGLSEEETRFAYSAGYIDAMALAGRSNPDLAAAWAEKYGENWKATVAEDIRKFQDAGEQAQTSRFEQSYDTTPSSEYAATEEDIVDAEVIVDEQETPARSEGEFLEIEARVIDDREIVYAEVIDPEPGPGFVAAPNGVLREADGSHEPRSNWSDEKAPGSGHRVKLERSNALLEAMSNHIAADIHAEAMSLGGADADGRSWEARHVYRSRSRALGVHEPALLNGAVDHADLSDHEPWDADQKANVRARDMVAMTQSMSRAGLNPKAQDALYSAAYVRGLEKVVAAEPDYLSVVQHMVGREGGDPEKWQEHEYSGAMHRSNSMTPTGSYSSISKQVNIAPVSELKVPITRASRSAAEDLLRENLEKTAKSQSHEQGPRADQKAARSRLNLHENGYEVVSGRFSDLTPVDLDPMEKLDEGQEPEFGG